MAEAFGTVRYVVTKPNGAEFDLADAQDSSSAYIESKDLDLGDPHVFKILRAFKLLISPHPFGTMQLVVRTRNSIKDAFRDYVLDARDTDKTIKARIRNCKYFRLRIQDDGIRERWGMTEIVVYGNAAGRRL